MASQSLPDETPSESQWPIGIRISQELIDERQAYRNGQARRQRQPIRMSYELIAQSPAAQARFAKWSHGSNKGSSAAADATTGKRQDGKDRSSGELASSGNELRRQDGNGSGQSGNTEQQSMLLLRELKAQLTTMEAELNAQFTTQLTTVQAELKAQLTTVEAKLAQFASMEPKPAQLVSMEPNEAAGTDDAEKYGELIKENTGAHEEIRELKEENGELKDEIRVLKEKLAAHEE